MGDMTPNEDWNLNAPDGTQINIKDLYDLVSTGRLSALSLASVYGSVNDRPISAIDARLGFVNDGVTDNAAAWSRLNALLTSPMAVYFPPGVYKTNINGISAFQPAYDVTLEGSGYGTQFTTDSVSTNGNLITPTTAINLTVRNVRATGTITGSATAQFINTGFTSGTATYLIENALFDGGWTTAIKSGGSGTETIDVFTNTVEYNLTNGTGVLNNAASGRVHVNNSKFTKYGLTASNQAHGLYVYRRISLRVSNTNFVTQNGSGYGIQHYGGAGDPEYSIVQACNFGTAAGTAITNYVPMRIDSTNFLGTSTNVVLRNDIELNNCSIAGSFIYGSDAPTGTNLQIRGGISTQTTAFITANVASMNIGIDGHRFSGLGTTISPFGGSQIATCNKSVINSYYGTNTRSSTTANRPSANDYGVGGMWQDTTLNKRIFSDGTNWRDGTGVIV